MGDIRRAEAETHTTWEEREDKRCPPGLGDPLNERQQKTDEERQQEQSNQDDGN